MGKKLNDKEIKEIVEKYNNGISGIELSKIYCCSSTLIYKVLKNNNVSVRSNKENSRKYTLNNNIFNEIDTIEKAYWLGFMYADGYVSINNNQKIFGISLSKKDKLHLIKFNNFLDSNYPINTYNGTGYSNGNEYCRLNITSDTVVKDLIKHGCVEHKTDTLKAPCIDENFVPHFIRGYLDGDGCITHYLMQGYDRYSVKILGTTNILNFINDFLEKNCNFRIKKYFKRKPGQKVSSIEIQGNIRSKIFLDLIYKNSTIYLDRKNNKYLELCDFMFSRAQ